MPSSGSLIRINAVSLSVMPACFIESCLLGQLVSAGLSLACQVWPGKARKVSIRCRQSLTFFDTMPVVHIMGRLTSVGAAVSIWPTQLKH